MFIINIKTKFKSRPASESIILEETRPTNILNDVNQSRTLS